jgi:myosin heavy subunit
MLQMRRIITSSINSSMRKVLLHLFLLSPLLLIFRLSAANHPTLAQCPLSSSTVSDYRILGSIEDLASNRKTVRQASMSETNTVDSFVEVENALRVLQMSEANILSVWNTLAAILEIGNILFVDEESPQGTVAKVENFEQCRLSAGLLNVTPESLQATLTQRVMTARGESYTISLNSKDAQNARNAICKAMYSAVFSSLVDVINAALTENMTSMDSSHFNSIGVLDIFGFEAFQHNEFEQVLSHTLAISLSLL